MTTLTHRPGELIDRLLTAVDTGASRPAWLQEIRAAARERFEAVGLPTPRDEEWRLTSLRRLEQMPFTAAPDRRGEVTATDIQGRLVPGLTGPRLVFLNGRHAPALSSDAQLPAGVTVLPLAEAVEAGHPVLEAHLARHADPQQDPFVALNTSCLENGLLVHVPAGTSVPDPIHVLSLTVATSGPVVTHPRVLVVAESGSSVTVVEDYASPGDDPYLTNAVTEIVVGPGADVHHYLLERESAEAINISTLKVVQQGDSRFASHSVLLGGALVRNNVNPVLDGENAHSLLNGLYVANGTHHVDNHMRVEHARPHGDSRQYYKGILDGEARGIFSGRIVVAQDAQKTDAVQSNESLLLSPDARAYSKPQLEIYADDVKCTHGATIGELDDQALFYLRSRGMSEPVARGMLVFAFALASLERMELEPVREYLGGRMLARLPLTQALREIW